MSNKLLGGLVVIAALIVAGVYLQRRDVMVPQAPDQNEEADNPDPMVNGVEVQFDNFVLAYPGNFKVEMSESLGGGFLDTSIVKLSFPEDAFKDEATNYNEAYLVVSKSNKSNIESICSTFSDLPNIVSPDTQPLVINGVTFKTQTARDAAAGNFYDSKLYRTMHGSECYEVALTIHTGNIHNYPEGTVTEFDQQKAWSVLEQVLHTFRFKD